MKCIICGIKIPKDNGELCKTCLEFFVFKYKNGLEKQLERYRKLKEVKR